MYLIMVAYRDLLTYECAEKVTRHNYMNSFVVSIQSDNARIGYMVSLSLIPHS